MGEPLDLGYFGEVGEVQPTGVPFPFAVASFRSPFGLFRRGRRGSAGRGGDRLAGLGGLPRPGQPGQELLEPLGLPQRGLEGTRLDQRLNVGLAASAPCETRSNKSSSPENGPFASGALTIASTALNPTPLIAASPNAIFPSQATLNLPSSLVDVRGRTSIPIRRQSSMCSTKYFLRSDPSISDESTAAMYSVG